VEEFKFVDSKFRFAILAARRAKQLIAGSKKRVEVNAENPLTVALKELAEGKVGFEILDDNYMEQELGLLTEEETTEVEEEKSEQEDVAEVAEAPAADAETN
jgi:DNA-directed RNA polymerase subunit omega